LSPRKLLSDDPDAYLAMARRIIIVGCGVSGTTAAFYARKTDRAAEITIAGDEELPEYSRCGLPYAFSGVVPTFRSLIGYDEVFYEQTNRVKLRLGWSIAKLDTSSKRVELVRVSDGKEETRYYDSLVITTGARASTLDLPGSGLKGIFTIRTMDDVEGLANHLAETKAKKVAIIGAGLTGSEMAEALLHRGISVLQAEIVPEILPAILDPDMASIVRGRAEKRGVDYHLGSTLEQFASSNGRVSAVQISGEMYPVDGVVVAVKVKPNTELAKNAGIQLGEFGGLRANDRMLTSAENVYAAGDCVETYDRVTRRYVLFQLATTGVRQAMVAGINAGGGDARYPGSTGVTTVKLFDLEVASFGPTTALAEKTGIHPVSIRVTGSTRLPYYPGGRELTVKLLAFREDGRILGAQLVGEEGATLRANLPSMAAHLGLSVKDFADIETCYSPPLAPVWDPVTIAAQALLKKLTTMAKAEPLKLGAR
jgi:NADPH-dependent 2,4-dienoyl-CoA reductase/sulfur reductase-like enzyme